MWKNITNKACHVMNPWETCHGNNAYPKWTEQSSVLRTWLEATWLQIHTGDVADAIDGRYQRARNFSLMLPCFKTVLRMPHGIPTSEGVPQNQCKD